MNLRNVLVSLGLAALLAACTSVKVEVWDSKQFSPHFQTYSWRSEPFTNNFYSRDPVYILDPILREIVDADLGKKGYQLVPRGGDFTIDYTYAPGVLMGASSEAVDNLSPRAGVRPNTTISQAERDNAIALSGVKETRNISLQIQDGKTGLEIWRALITKIADDVNKPDKSRLRSALGRGVSQAFQDLPSAG